MTRDALSTAQKGALGEDAAVSYLESKGWEVLARNFRVRVGEIDVIARQGDTVAFVEVKSWRSVPREDLARSIGPGKVDLVANGNTYDDVLLVACRPAHTDAMATGFEMEFLQHV